MKLSITDHALVVQAPSTNSPTRHHLETSVMSASPAASPSPGPSGSNHRHAATPLEKQRAQLEKLLKDPTKPVHLPAPLKDKTIRPAREMMKNVQGSSAGAGSGEFHVYKASRRREYERLKLMEEEALKVRLSLHARVAW